ncbi:MAG: hypothetical protein ABI970_22825 [Chloroflexota bacterium]|nr:hypothetical protein [Anaerolineae bacterium]
MKFIQWQQNPLKLSIPLMWVEEIEFTTHLKLEECYAKLAFASNNNDKKQAYYGVREVLWDGEDVYFWLGMSRSYGRGTGRGELIGKLSREPIDGKVYAHCYVGQPIELFVIGISIVSWIFFFFNVVYGHVERIAVLIGILLSAIPGCLLILSTKNLSEEVRGELKYYCQELFTESSLRRNPFKL